MATFPNPAGVRLAHALKFPVTDEEEMRRRLLQLNVYYITPEEKHMTQHPRYNAFEIFSRIGGLMGLCLGVSLISVLELYVRLRRQLPDLRHQKLENRCLEQSCHT